MGRWAMDCCYSDHESSGSHRGEAVLQCLRPFEPWHSLALHWAMKGYFSPCSLLCSVFAWPNDFFISHMHLASVGLGGSFLCFDLLFSPMPFSFFGVCVLKQNASLICYCSSSCGFVWLGRKKISAQMVLYVPSICFDCVTNCLL